MKPEEFTKFEDQEPDKDRWIIVTNNINVKNAFGEMSHVWLTNFYTKRPLGGDGFVMFDDNSRRIIKLTHWKYA